MSADELTGIAREGDRILTICNACRYCEGYCAVFPALERRLDFAAADLDYLANLCHNCAECYYACQYAPPHEFAVNVPKTLAADSRALLSALRVAAPLAAAFRRNGLMVSLALVIALAIWIVATSGSTSIVRSVLSSGFASDDGRDFRRCVAIRLHR